nr:hypothetical protein [Tanacetum cinerariifolium]
MFTPVFVDLEISTQADGAQSSQVPVPFPEDPYEAIRQAYLVDGAQSSRVPAPLPEDPYKAIKTARMAMRVSTVMSHSLCVGIAEVEVMSNTTFRKSEEDEEVEESLDSDSESEDAKDEGPTGEDGDPTVGEEGLAVGTRALVWELRVKSHVLDDEVHSVENDGFGLREGEAVPEGQQRAVPVVGTAVSEPLGLGYKALRHRELALDGDHVYSTFEPTITTWIDLKDGMAYIVAPTSPPEWSSGLFPISPAPFVAPSPIPSPMISLTIPSPIASPMATSTATIPVDEDHFIEEHELERTAVTFGALWRPVLALEAWAWHVNTRMTDILRARYDDHRLVHDMLLQQTALQRELQELRGFVTPFEQERDHRSHCLSRVSGYDPVLDVMTILSKLALPIFSVIQPIGLTLQGIRPTQYDAHSTLPTLTYSKSPSKPYLVRQSWLYLSRKAVS